MSFPVLVEAENGYFAASLLGAVNLRVVEPTRDEAVAALKTELQQRIQKGELLSVEVGELATIGVSDLVGKYRDDPTLREICEQAYQLRDAENVK
ncbi:MAG: hypothetical protein KA368_21150 [Acidobacteria bacterium]|nr:hypothetical protein [Acidobacteriota bacterium]